MANKKLLLNEDVTRKFMKLANLGSLSEGFMEDVEEGMGAYARDDEEELGPDAAADEVVPDLDVEDAPEAEADVDSAEIESLVNAIADAIEAETGVPVSVDGAADEGGEEEPVADDPMPEPDVEADVDDDLEAADVTLEEDGFEDRVVNEVTRRVARRLLRQAASANR